MPFDCHKSGYTKKLAGNFYSFGVYRSSKIFIYKTKWNLPTPVLCIRENLILRYLSLSNVPLLLRRIWESLTTIPTAAVQHTRLNRQIKKKKRSIEWMKNAEVQASHSNDMPHCHWGASVSISSSSLCNLFRLHQHKNSGSGPSSPMTQGCWATTSSVILWLGSATHDNSKGQNRKQQDYRN